MIQDIYPKVFHNEFHDEQPMTVPHDEERVLVYDGGKALVKFDAQDRLTYPTVEDFKGRDVRYTYLFSIDNKAYFLGEPQDGFLPDGYSFEKISIFRSAAPKVRSFAGVTGHSLYEWYQAHRFCGRCGTPMEKDHRERMVRCPKCGLMIYPRISPGVIVGVINNGKILMSKYAGGGYRHFALIAGFTEIGETIEQTVHREVMEEVGIRVKNLRFYKSQPWPFSNSLLMGFFCDLDGDDRLTLQEDELAEAGWYRPEEVPEDIDHIALTQEMMTMFKNGTYPR
ncbi:MAG: NAD(+) diphosphatase [Bilifractor sp.]|jgi:NAD+ diphosphatase